jgi:hypothetical protein
MVGSKKYSTAGFALYLALLPLPPCGQPHYQRNITATANWTTSGASSLPDGAILYTSTRIMPYYSNLAAIGLARTANPVYYPKIKDWMQWYISHLNYPDKWGLSCTIYDYNVSGSTETATNDADSTDSYAATFASLAWAYWQTGDPTAQNYIRSLRYELDCIGGVIVQTQQRNGLTWAKPDYQIQYLMDNCEVYKGLRDLANIFEYAFNDTTGRDGYNSYAEKAFNGIQTVLWDAAHNNYLTYAGAPPTNWSVWYPDSTAQLFPVLYRVLAPTDVRAKHLYNMFNRSWPNWTSLNFPDPFPWAVVSAAAAQMNDTARVNSYIVTIQNKYVNKGFLWPWYCAESGWFIRVNRYMLVNTRFSP